MVESWEFHVPERDFFVVSAPMTGYDKFNLPAIRRACEGLRRSGIVAFNPFENQTASSLASLDDSFFRTKYLPVVAHERCLGVVLLDRWWESKGCMTEVLLAERFGKVLLRFVEEDRHPVLEFYERTAT